MSDHSGDIDVCIDNLDLNVVRLLNEGDIVGLAIMYDTSNSKFIAHDLTLLTKTRIGIDYKNTNKDYDLKYRHLSHINDKKLAKNIQLRSNTLSSLRKLLADEGFMEIDTPSSSISRRLYISPNLCRDRNIRWITFYSSVFTGTIF